VGSFDREMRRGVKCVYIQTPRELWERWRECAPVIGLSKDLQQVGLSGLHRRSHLSTCAAVGGFHSITLNMTAWRRETAAHTMHVASVHM